MRHREDTVQSHRTTSEMHREIEEKHGVSENKGRRFRVTQRNSRDLHDKRLLENVHDRDEFFYERKGKESWRQNRRSRNE